MRMSHWLRKYTFIYNTYRSLSVRRRKQDEVQVLEESIRIRSEIHKKAGIELNATCHICLKTKFADGVGHICNYCEIRCCARCGGKVTLRSSKVRGLSGREGIPSHRKDKRSEKSWGRTDRIRCSLYPSCDGRDLPSSSPLLYVAVLGVRGEKPFEGLDVKRSHWKIKIERYPSGNGNRVDINVWSRYQRFMYYKIIHTRYRRHYICLLYAERNGKITFT